MNKTIFWALPLSIDVAQNVRHSCEIDRLATSAGWQEQPLSRFHITMVYIGVLAQEKIDIMLKAMRCLLNNFVPLTVSAKEMAIWSNGNRHHLVVRLQLDKDLECLREQLMTNLNKIDIAFDQRPFQPHITLASCFGECKDTASYAGQCFSDQGVYWNCEHLHCLCSDRGLNDSVTQWQAYTIIS